jgi:hypothetical protein
MSKLQPPLVAILVALVILAGCSSVPTDEDVAASVEARLAVAQTETVEAVTSETPVLADTTTPVPSVTPIPTETSVSTETASPVPTSTSILPPDDDIITPSVVPTTINDPNGLLVEGWESFDSKNLSLSFLYPKAAKVINNQDGEISVVRRGPTQTEGTELFDGYALTFSKGNYDTDFSQLVEDFRSISATNPAISETSEISKYTTPYAEGLLFTKVGLGEFDNIFLPLTDSEYLFVSRLVSDPQQLGFLAETDTIIFSVNQ